MRRPAMPGALALLPVAVVAGVLLAALAGAAPALAQGPWWRLESRSAPTNLPPGGEGEIIVAATNLGDGEAPASEAHPITLADTLPGGAEAIKIIGKRNGQHYGPGIEEPGVTCSLESSKKFSCSDVNPVRPYQRFEVEITVEVDPGAASGEQNTVSVQGGEAPPTPPLSVPIVVSGEPTRFGVEADGYQLEPEAEGGAPATQAGSHPFQLTTTLNFNQTLAGFEGEPTLLPSAPALVRNLRFQLPPGLLGDPTAVPQCSSFDFSTEMPAGEGNLCEADTVVGVAVVTLNEPQTLRFITLAVPVFNLAPALGEPARFGFYFVHDLVYLDTAVRSAEGYAVQVSVSNTTQIAQLLGSEVTLWGEPGAASHDSARGWACVEGGRWAGPGESCTPPGERSTKAFLTLPTACTEQPLVSSVEGESWPVAGAPRGLDLQASSPVEPMRGCAALPFSPSIGVETDQHAASTPTGMSVDVKLPQQSTEADGELAESDVRDTTVTLPEGLLLSPGAANGLLACTGERVGLEPGAQESAQTENNGFSEEPPVCPEAAKVGTVKIRTPLLPNELEGSLYLASQDTNPFQAPLVLYLIAEDPVAGVLVKLAGKVTPNPETGQLTSTFENTPQLPFEELELHFFDGARASLSTPPSCGTYTTTSSFTPWSGGPSEAPSSSFQIGSGPSGSPCANPQPFAPSFDAQTTNLQAGAFTPFTLNVTRPDADQAVRGLTLHLPPGVAALLASVTPCVEPRVADNECGPESLIGHSTASAGLGPEPYTLPGSVYFTGPYRGAPFGLSVVTPAVAGPFNLGDVTVRSTIEVDPSTAAVTIASDPFPTIVKGVPVQLKQLNVTVDRPGFQFNPTNCDPMAVTGTLTGAQGGSEAVSSPFQVANCASLPFKPKLTASVGGHASKAGGASLDVKITSAGLGQANVHKVDLTLPKALPSRLTTLQKACVEAVFDANPAACDAGSVIGSAVVRTPVLRSPLTGPAYLVSHGGAAFPDVEFVLQGEGVTLIVDGKTDIKDGVTYSKFETAPDAPFTSFETVLPTGPHSVLTANVPGRARYSLCGRNLAMPTEITGQNGALIEQTTKIAVTGCRAALDVVGKERSGGWVLLTLRSTVAGTLTVTGAGLRRTREKLAVGEHRVRVALTRAGRRRGRLGLRLVLKSGKTSLSKVVRLSRRARARKRAARR